MTEIANQPQQQPQQPNPPTRAEIQLILWNNCRYIGEIIEDFKTGKKAPSKKWSQIVYLMQGQNTLLKTLLESIKDSEIDELAKQLAEIKEAMKQKGTA